MKQIELIEKRSPREKHFLQEDGTIIAEIYDDDVHYFKDGKYEEIDNTLIEEQENYVNKSNSFKVSFKKESKDELMRMESAEHYLNIKLKGKKNSVLKKIMNRNQTNEISYESAMDNIDLDYKVMPTKVKESIIIKNRTKIPTILTFLVESDLTLILNNDKKIDAIKDGKSIFTIESPYMIDAQGNINNNVYYKLNGENGSYSLDLVLDSEWLNDANTMYPVIVDPTITQYSNSNSCYDTYIYPGDTNVNRNNHEYLKAGVEMVNGSARINRALIKFGLPTLGTGSQIIKAKLNLVGYPISYNDSGAYNTDIINIHRLTSDWTETGANWNNMNANYDPKIEGTFYSLRSLYYPGNPATVQANKCGDDITSLVKKWYSSDLPNYGIMLKMNTETYHTSTVPQFYSKNNSVQGTNPKPLLSITYRNQNGLESYMHYKIQEFSQGNSYVNTYNGNLTTIFNVGQTISGKFPATLKLVYNTNDVVLQKDVGYGIGYMLNYNQIIKQEIIDETTYLSFTDSDGTIHYFYQKDGKYVDEDGLNLTIAINSNNYILTDKDGSSMKFTIDSNSSNQIGYLSEICDLKNNKIQIQYTNNLITKIVDANNQEITITYGTNIITITSPEQTVYLDYDSSNKLTTIRTIYGNISFAYNTNNVITEITDYTGLSISYEYYNQSPYRMKKVTQIGLSNAQGASINFEYDYNSTTLTDNNQKITTLIFNDYGNLITITNLKSSQDLTDAYGKLEEYGESYMENGITNYKYKNKVLTTEIPFKYIKNYLSNSSFEKDSIDFQASSNVLLSLSTDYSEIGLTSLRITSTGNNSRYFYREIAVPKGNNYTFSGYIKNDNNLKVSMYYFDNNNNQVISSKENIGINDEFNRYDVSIYYPEDATSNLFILFEIDTNGIIYLDCVQLEKGEVANHYNMLENSDFSDGFDGWQLRVDDIEDQSAPTIIQPVNNIDPTGTFEIVSLSNDQKALKVNMNPKKSTNLSATLNLKGKKDESYNISFWYKNTGLPAGNAIGDSKFNNVTINFNYTEEVLGHGGIMSKGFNPNDNEWQYFQSTFVAEENFDKLYLDFFQYFNANELYITNMTLIKSYGKTKYDYDINGNVIEMIDEDNDSGIFKYDINNKLIKMIDHNGKNITNEYDSEVTDRLLNSVSPKGLISETMYDNFDNPYLYRSVNYGKNETIDSGYYRIRLKGTYNYIASLQYSVTLSNPQCNHYLWYLEKTQITEIVNNEQVTKDVYKFKHPILNKYIKVIDNMVVLSNDYSLFELSKNDNGSFYIIDRDANKYIKKSSNGITISDLINDDYSFEFFFENTNKSFIEENITYSSDGRFIESVTDSLLHKTLYNIDSQTGLINSITDPNGQITSYNYDNKRRIASVTKDNRTISYTYNNNGVLQSITTGNRNYNFIYDNFLNTQQFKVGNNTLITNVFEANNGELSSSTYGNNDQISLTYDGFKRLKSLNLMDNIFNYKYGSNGDLIKVVSNDAIYKYTYDLSRKIREYRFNDFRVKYDYDSNENVSHRKYMLNNTAYSIDNTFDSDNNIINSNIGQDEITYLHDYLGRIQSKCLNNSITTNYSYVSNGNRTSLLVRDLVVNNDSYSYRYNRLNNITHIYKNSALKNEYCYDAFGELISESNYEDNEKILYEYDIYGNILSKKIYNLTTNVLISQKLYEYNNQNWIDQLTRYDNELITYDAIGNPLTIGTRTLSWINGNQLHTYSYGNNTITYKYNCDGIRIGKTINNTPTNYYLDGNRIVFETNGNNILSYLYDGDGDLFGFKYNSDKYYYIKNLLGDIIGILNNNYQLVAKYKYDSFGNNVSITDANDNDVSNVSNHIANINPFRYRGYYYDKETQLYYLNSRYYNPLWGRFLNVDSLYSTNQGFLGYNMYLYCLNNFNTRIDTNGNCSYFWFIKIKDCKSTTCPTSKKYKVPKADLSETIKSYGTYGAGDKNGNIYIVSEDQKEEALKLKKENDVVAVDKRIGNSDPTIQIVDSYLIESNKHKKEIIKVLLNYDEENPSEIAWNRTEKGLLKEWKIHNNLYNINVATESTQHADFNTNDEGMGYWDYFVKYKLKK